MQALLRSWTIPSTASPSVTAIVVAVSLAHSAPVQANSSTTSVSQYLKHSLRPSLTHLRSRQTWSSLFALPTPNPLPDQAWRLPPCPSDIPTHHSTSPATGIELISSASHLLTRHSERALSFLLHSSKLPSHSGHALSSCSQSSSISLTWNRLKLFSSSFRYSKALSTTISSYCIPQRTSSHSEKA